MSRSGRGRFVWLISAGFSLLPASLGAQAQDRVCERGSFSPLVRLVGEWEVRAEDRRTDLTFESSTGRAAISMALDGCGLVERFSGTRQGKPYSTLSVLVLTADGQLELARADSEHGGLTVAFGPLESNVATLIWKRDLGTRILSTRTTYTVESSDSFRVERRLQRSESEEWEVTYRGSYRRASPSPNPSTPNKR